MYIWWLICDVRPFFVYIYMLQLLNSPIFEGHDKKNTANSKKPPRRIRTFATIFFWWLFKQTNWGIFAWVFLVLRWEDYFSPSARWLMAEMICEKKNGRLLKQRTFVPYRGNNWVVAICFKCSSLFRGNDAIWLAHIFLKGWFDHQLDTYLVTSDWWISGCFFWLRFWSFQKGHFWVVVSKIFYFHPYLGKISNLTNVFQMGWNHQLDTLYGG